MTVGPGSLGLARDSYFKSESGPGLLPDSATCLRLNDGTCPAVGAGHWQPLLPRTVGIMSQSGSVQVNATRAFTVGGCRQATVNFTEVPSEDSEAVNHDGGSLA